MAQKLLWSISHGPNHYHMVKSERCFRFDLCQNAPLVKAQACNTRLVGPGSGPEVDLKQFLANLA